MVFMDSVVLEWEGTELWVSRSGYTGEDGLKYRCHTTGQRLAGHCCHGLVIPVGLGARDSLRMEAGMPLWQRTIRCISPVSEPQLGDSKGQDAVAEQGRGLFGR